MALASLPPSEGVMKDRPRHREAFIIDSTMKRGIIGTGALFFLILIGLVYVFEHADVTALTDLCTLTLGGAEGLSRTEKSYIFTIFVMLQFWNLFNARAYLTGRSAFHFKGCQGFLLILLVILIGQFFIVSFGGQMFSVTPISMTDWALIIGSTSIVMWVGEIYRFLRR